MSRARILLLLAIAVGFTAWLTMRRSPAAAAASSQQGEDAATYGENTEEVAFHRWESNQSRHWRQAVTRH